MPLVPSNDPAAKDGMVRSHRFPAANTALPFVNDDAEQLKAVQDFLQDGAGLGRHLRAGARARRPPTPATTGRASAPISGLASTFAVGEESMNFGAHAGVPRRRRPT